MAHYHEVMDEVRGPYQELQEAIPGSPWATPRCTRPPWARATCRPRSRSSSRSAIAITRECDGCIAAHARAAARRGATAAEVAEMIGVTILMNGGPGTVWGPRALAAFHEFADG